MGLATHVSGSFFVYLGTSRLVSGGKSQLPPVHPFHTKPFQNECLHLHDTSHIIHHGNTRRERQQSKSDTRHSGRISPPVKIYLDHGNIYKCVFFIRCSLNGVTVIPSKYWRMYTPYAHTQKPIFAQNVVERTARGYIYHSGQG